MARQHRGSHQPQPTLSGNSKENMIHMIETYKSGTLYRTLYDETWALFNRQNKNYGEYWIGVFLPKGSAVGAWASSVWLCGDSLIESNYYLLQRKVIEEVIP